jgi:SAM-dependent methyltransferase
LEPQHELLTDAWAFMKSRVIFTAAELDFFTLLDQNPSTAQDLAEIHRLDLRATTRMLDCLITFGLLDKEHNLYRPTAKGILLSAKHPKTLLPMILHLNHLWSNWSKLTDIVRQGSNPDQDLVGDWGGEIQQAFIGAMHAIGRDLAEEIAQSYDLKPFKRLLDIGGASGTYTIAFLRQNPQMTAVIFDFDNVLALADDRLQRHGLRSRVELTPGDFYRDDLPPGCDLALLSAIIHQNSPEENVDLYRKIYQALEPGGVLLIRDHVMDESRTYPPAGATFALNMLVNTRGGDTYTFPEIKETLAAAGFRAVQQVRSGERMDCLVEARK